MTDLETATEAEETPVLPGTLLKEKRESLGLTQKQIADRLRLRLVVVQSLEENDLNIDKVSTFTRGYLRSYAKVVGIPDADILSAYDAYYGTAALEDNMKSFSRKTTREQHNSRNNWITFGIAFVVIGISSVWWYQNQKDDMLLPRHTTATTSSNQKQTSSIHDETQSIATVAALNKKAEAEGEDKVEEQKETHVESSQVLNKLKRLNHQVDRLETKAFRQLILKARSQHMPHIKSVHR